LTTSLSVIASRSAALLLLSAVCANACFCIPPSGPCGFDAGTPLVAASDGGFVRFEAPTLSVRLELGTLERCNGEPPEAPTATSEVFGPTNRAISSEVEVVSAGAVHSFASVVTFPSDGPGWYHVVVRTGFGNHQADLLVVVDGSDAGPSVELPFRCGALVEDTPGGLLCGHRFLRPDGGVSFLTSTRTDATVDTALQPLAASAWPLLWGALDGPFIRFTDTGTELTNSSLLNHWSPIDRRDAGQLLATGDEALMVSTWSQGVELQRFTHDAGAVFRSGKLEWVLSDDERELVPNLLPLAVRSGAGQYWVAAAVDETPEGVFIPSRRSRVCRVSSDAGAPTVEAETCRSLGGVPLGVDEGALWLYDVDEVTAYRPNDAGELDRVGSERLISALHAVLPNDDSPQPPQGRSPQFTFFDSNGLLVVVLPQLTDAGIALKAYRTPTSFFAAQRKVWLSDPNGTRIYER
jgi:hypothetical protein